MSRSIDRWGRGIFISSTFGSRARDPQRHTTPGQVLVLFAMSIFVLVGFVALSIDGGYILAERRQVQAAADAGAMAAAVDVLRNTGLSQVTAAGREYAVTNSGVPASNVTVDWPPASGRFQGNRRFVQVTVSKDVAKFFVAALYSGQWRTSATATAGVEPIQEPYALLVLNKPGLYINGNTNVSIPNGSIMVNSDIKSSGTSNIVHVGGTISATGSIQGNSSWSQNQMPNLNYTVPDPIAVKIQDGTAAPPPTNILNVITTLPDCFNSNCTLQPGWYRNLGELRVGNGRTATLSGGIYYFEGTRIRLYGSSSLFQSDTAGPGVLLYFAPGSPNRNSNTATTNFDPGTGGIKLKFYDKNNSGGAGYAGAVPGMLLWIDNCSQFISSGTSAFSIEGVIYAPCSHVQLHGTPESNGLQVIVGTLDLVGTSTFGVQYRNFVQADRPRVFLVE